MATTTTTLRFDSADKEEASALLKSMGISFNGYLGMAVKQLINQRRIPFEILPAEAEAAEGGEFPQGAKTNATGSASSNASVSSGGNSFFAPFEA